MELRPRPVALAVIRVNDEILVCREYDPGRDEVYYRPLGGSIEFGEHSEAAIHRELSEELSVAVTSARLVAVIENRFVVGVTQGHEIDFVYEVSVAEIERLRTAPIVAVEANGSSILCLWKRIDDFHHGERLYPEGLLALLA